jgi:hypothetical protein
VEQDFPAFVSAKELKSVRIYIFLRLFQRVR